MALKKQNVKFQRTCLKEKYEQSSSSYPQHCVQLLKFSFNDRMSLRYYQIYLDIALNASRYIIRFIEFKFTQSISYINTIMYHVYFERLDETDRNIPGQNYLIGRQRARVKPAGSCCEIFTVVIGTRDSVGDLTMQGRHDLCELERRNCSDVPRMFNRNNKIQYKIILIRCIV